MTEAEFDGRCRVVIEGVEPQIDAGRYPIKRTLGDTVRVEADVFCDGHDDLAVLLRYRAASSSEWEEIPMLPMVNDRWAAEFQVDQIGRYQYTVVAWVDHFLSWRNALAKRIQANQVATVDLQIGAGLFQEAAQRATSADRERLSSWADRLTRESSGSELGWVSDEQVLRVVRRNTSRDLASVYAHNLEVSVERVRARSSAWYELFPRSAAAEPGQHGTLKDVEARLEYVSRMGFDVLYLPPIHPIGQTDRKGQNNATVAGPDDVGSPWGIGAQEGGHKAVHPALGTLDDFRRLVDSAKRKGIEVAMDIAFQCSPDHPYVSEHPDWFRKRPDGTIQFAENPPKKYQDIFPFDFECKDWQGLWEELKSVFVFWIEQGVRIFRVDNPHTKPFPFWEWCIREVKRKYPNTLFLAEAFTRPKIMHRLAKLGFSQSYTYFAWRNTKRELQEYMNQLTQTEVKEFFRPNFWPNTPDILTEYLQVGGRPAFMSRLVLAATLSSNYGIYGPPFEHMWCAPREPGSEEYLDSEKYQVHHHKLDREDSLVDFIARVNGIRRACNALQKNDHLRFHNVDNEQLICFSKASHDLSEIVLVVVNLDPRFTHSGWVDLPLDQLKLDDSHPYQLFDMLSDARYLWHGSRNFVQLDPEVIPAHVFQIQRSVRTELDFEYFL